MKNGKNVSLYHSVKFLRASSTLETFKSLDKKAKTSRREHGAGLSGEEAKTFYEKLLEESNEKHTQREPRSHKVKSKQTESNNSKTRDMKSSLRKCSVGTRESKSKLKLSSSDSRQLNLFLKMAQDGNIDGLSGMLEVNRLDINATDQFGWTALMCACHSRQKACVKFLLKQGARTDLRSKKGETAEDIARLHHGRFLQDMFYKQKRRKSKRQKREVDQLSHVNETSVGAESAFCEICNITFTSTSLEHNTSTTHLFNCQYKSERTVYHIPESNVGFQLMTKTGWDKEKGLGPEGTGRKFPVKTVLKRDRRGLGSKQKDKARITHYSPGDPRAVEGRKRSKVEPRVAKITTKRKLVEQQKRERKWEHNMRVYMNTE